MNSLSAKPDGKAEPLASEDMGQRIRRWDRFARWSVACALVVVTAYVGVMAVLWSQRVSELHGIASDLEAQLDMAESTMRVGGIANTDLVSDLEQSHDRLLVSANHSVQAQEGALFLSYMGTAMGYCIDASWQVVYIVNYKWGLEGGPWSWNDPFPRIHARVDPVLETCQEISGIVSEVIEEIEANIPAPEPTAMSS